MYLTSGNILLSMVLLFNAKCDECKTYTMVYDENKGESFCLKCGLIHQEKYKIVSIVEDMKRILENSKNTTI